MTMQSHLCAVPLPFIRSCDLSALVFCLPYILYITLGVYIYYYTGNIPFCQVLFCIFFIFIFIKVKSLKLLVNKRRCKFICVAKYIFLNLKILKFTSSRINQCFQLLNLALFYYSFFKK